MRKADSAAQSKGDFLHRPGESSSYLRCPAPFTCHESLKLEWAFGLHKDFKSVIHNLSVGNSQRGSVSSHPVSQEKRQVFYPVAHVGVLYDAVHNTQKHLMGHTYTIVATCCSHNRRYIVTADEGDRSAWGLRNTTRATAAATEGGNEPLPEDDYNLSAEDEARMRRDPREACIPEEDDGSVMIVWDTVSGLPVKTIPVGKYGGVVCCAMSLDGLYIATINRRTPQEIMVWGWTAEKDQEENELEETGSTESYDEGFDMVPEFVRRIPSQDEQTSIRFSSDNSHLFCTNGLRRVLFWSWVEGELKYYSPPILQKDLKVPVGNFTQTIMVPGTTMGCSGTVDGDVLLWELQPKDRVMKEQDKTLLKMVRVHSGGVTFVTCEGGYIVTGGMDGNVKFLDQKLRLVAWFEDLNGGPVISVSFDRPVLNVEESQIDNELKTRRHVALQSVGAASHFTSADFMVSTANAMIIDVPSKAFHSASRELLRGKLIVQGQDQAIQCLAAHPLRTQLAIAGLSGNLHLWDYQQKRVLMLSLFRNLLVQSMVFDPKGIFIMVGFTNGVLKVLDAATLEEKQSFKPKRVDSILKICFSDDSRMMAVGTAGGYVGLYEYVHRHHDPSRPMEWEFVGYHKTHRAAICGLQFAHNTNGEAIRLLSVGEDKRLIEYNLVESDVESGLLLRTAHKITQGPIPTGFLWARQSGVLGHGIRPTERQFEVDGIPILSDEDTSSNSHSSQGTPGRRRGHNGKEPTDFLLVATNEYKIGVYLSDWSRQCVKTVLGPTFGGPITDMAIVPAKVGGDAGDSDANAKCLAYCTREKVIGLMQLPLRGDPCASMGLLAHPGAIQSSVVSFDGAYMFTAGGEDQSVLQWKVDGTKIMPVEELEAVQAAPENGVPLDHLIATVEGGMDGELMKEIIDYFYYAQIRAQGEETTAKRELLGAIHFSQLPNLLRALGYYPSELEIGHLTYEVANLYGPKGQALAEINVDAILLNFSQFMRLYVNYRPVFGITRQDIEAAFMAIGADPSNGQISRDAFFELLSTKGEPLRVAEIAAALTSLLGDGVRVDMLEDIITARTFSENLLGFEDYDGGMKRPEEDEEEEDSDLYHDDDDALGV